MKYTKCMLNKYPQKKKKNKDGQIKRRQIFHRRREYHFKKVNLLQSVLI